MSFQEKTKGIKEVRVGTTREVGVCVHNSHTCMLESATSKETGTQVSGARPADVPQESSRSKEACYLDQEAGKNPWEARQREAEIPVHPKLTSASAQEATTVVSEEKKGSSMLHSFKDTEGKLARALAQP